MATFEQAAQAKVFLRDYARALHTLDQIATQESELTMYNKKKKIVEGAILNKQISVEGDEVKKGPQFQQSRLVSLNRHSKELFSSYLQDFDQQTNFLDLKKILKQAIRHM